MSPLSDWPTCRSSPWCPQHSHASVLRNRRDFRDDEPCVLTLARQTRPPELVVVADNGSTDQTVAVLEGLADLPFQLLVRRMPENRGNAFAARNAMTGRVPPLGRVKRFFTAKAPRTPSFKRGILF